jgi:hypothetical protein
MFLPIAVLLLSGVEAIIGARIAERHVADGFSSGASVLGVDDEDDWQNFQGALVGRASEASEDELAQEADEGATLEEEAKEEVKPESGVSKLRLLGIAVFIICCAITAYFVWSRSLLRRSKFIAEGESYTNNIEASTEEGEATAGSISAAEAEPAAPAGPTFRGEVEPADRSAAKSTPIDSAADHVDLEDEPMSGQRSVKFKPGELGIAHADWGTGQVKDVDFKGQARDQGLSPGVQITEIDGEPYTEELLDARRTGKKEFTVTFKQDQP